MPNLVHISVHGGLLGEWVKYNQIYFLIFIYLVILGAIALHRPIAIIRGGEGRERKEEG